MRQALAIRKQLLGPDSADVASTLSSLADVMAYQGRFKEGPPLIEDALRIRTKHFGDRSQPVAKSIADLGRNYGGMGDFKQAEEYLRRAADIQRALHPNGHPELSEAVNNLALALMELGRPMRPSPCSKRC